MPHVADDPDDLHFPRHLLTIVEPHAAADRIAAVEEFSRERLVDDGHRRRATAIGGIERATPPQRNTERPEVVSGDHSIVRFGRVLGDDAVQKEGGGGEIAVHRNDVGRRDGANAGEGRDSRLRLVGELFDRGPPTVPRAGSDSRTVRTSDGWNPGSTASTC